MANLITAMMETGVKAMGSRQVSTKNIIPFHHYSAATYLLTQESIAYFFLSMYSCNINDYQTKSLQFTF